MRLKGLFKNNIIPAHYPFKNDIKYSWFSIKEHTFMKQFKNNDKRMVVLLDEKENY